MPHILRAMISSTARDLSDYRRAVMDACLSVDVFPYLMEHLPAVKADAVETSLKMVAGADIYIGIFAHRYGYIPAGHDVSITEMEYWCAIERGIPVLIFLIDDTYQHPELKSQTDDSELAQQQLDRFKTHLKTKHVVNFFKSPDDLRAHVLKGLWHTLLNHSNDAPKVQQKESEYFSDILRQRFASTQSAINSLTNDQFQVLNILRYQRHVLVAGCAGSGKTLIAIQKALLLDKAGARTLILCHNRNLARYIDNLVQGTGITVIDFTTWVNQIIGKKEDLTDQWSNYEEPSQENITLAFDQLSRTSDRYDAILVDEGQDFRDEWWLLVEAALINPEYGILYIFCDDNQALLPHRSKYPITAPPVILSKNCRNAGEVYDVVRRFHHQSPEPSIQLKGEGLTKRWVFDIGNEISIIKTAVQDMQQILQLENMVVLTTEPDPIEQTLLYGSIIDLPPVKRWQDFLMNYLRTFGYPYPTFQLSDSPLPTSQDIEIVKEYALKIYSNTWGSPQKLREKHTWNWKETDHGFTVTGERRLAKFTFDDWADDLPLAQHEQLAIGNARHASSRTLPLFTVASYKGLEADGVILFAPKPDTNLSSLVYVGASRAKLVLYIVAEKWVMEHVPYLLGAKT
jgi:hypothetical protein